MFKKLINNILGKLGYRIVQRNVIVHYQKVKPLAIEFSFLQNYPTCATQYLLYRERSKAQLKQDLFVLAESNFKRNGFFVEFGATDGCSLSNTFILEKDFNWSGILVEPGKIWQEELNKNRKVFIDHNCVWSSSGEKLVFNEVERPSLSSVKGYERKEDRKIGKLNNKKYEVNTITLYDLLKKYNAPKVVDYLSIDTEGSEFEILRDFKFKEYKFRVITVEHNFTPNREKIYDLLTSQGYERVHENISFFDDWFILKNVDDIQ